MIVVKRGRTFKVEYARICDKMPSLEFTSRKWFIYANGQPESDWSYLGYFDTQKDAIQYAEYWAMLSQTAAQREAATPIRQAAEKLLIHHDQHLTHYCIPYWCKMSMYDHFDGMGGCWGISTGKQLEGGEAYCKSCEFYKDNVDKGDGNE